MDNQRSQAYKQYGYNVQVPDKYEYPISFSDYSDTPIEHAVAIKRYNGASGGHYCFWNNSGGYWDWNEYNTDNPPRNYVADVCSTVAIK